MHIVIDARELRTTTGRYVERLIHYLQIVDKSNSYTILLSKKDFDGWKPKNRRFKKVSTRYKEFTFGEQLGFWRQIKQLKPDLVFFPMVQQPILYRGKVVTTMQDLTTIRFRNPSKNWLVFTVKQWVYRWVNVIVAHKSAALITPSQFVKDDVARFTHTNSRKYTVTYESADAIPDKPEPMPEFEGKQYLLYVGRPLPHKNLGRLIEAFVQLKQKHPGLRLVLAGKKDSLYKAHERNVKKQNIPGVEFTGFVSEGQLRWLYENAAAYAFPSLSEGFGLPALEAMLHGAPVASSNATCSPEIYGDAAHYFDPYNVEDMADKINDILTDNKLRDRLINKGHAQANKYSWERMAQQTLEVFENVLK